jgi:hypothetical protein
VTARSPNSRRLIQSLVQAQGRMADSKDFEELFATYLLSTARGCLGPRYKYLKSRLIFLLNICVASPRG